MQNFSGCVGRCQADGFCKICPRKIFDILKMRSLFTRCPLPNNAFALRSQQILEVKHFSELRVTFQ